MKLEVLVTSGGTAAKIDDVRHLGNFSSGTTGAFIAEEFLKAGFRVHYIYGKNAKRPFREMLKMNPKKSKEEELKRLSLAHDAYNHYSQGLFEYPIFTFEEYLDKTKEILTGKKIDVVVLAAAVGDYGYNPKEGKMSSDENKLVLEFSRNPKVISLIKEWNACVYQVGFKLLSRVSEEELIETAYKHGEKNYSDLTVANVLVNGNFAQRKIFLIAKNKKVFPVSERQLAPRLVEYVVNELDKKCPAYVRECF